MGLVLASVGAMEGQCPTTGTAGTTVMASHTALHQFKSAGIGQACMCHLLGRNVHLGVCSYCMAPDFNLQGDFFTTVLPQLLLMGMDRS